MKKILLILGFLFTSLNGLWATELAGQEQVEFSIRYFDKKIYYPETPVSLQVSIRNRTNAPYRFKAADNKVFNLNFQVQAAERSGIPMDNAEEFNRELFNNQPILYREFSLNPGEEYSYTVEDLNFFVDVKKPGLYSLSANFYPDLVIGADNHPLQSNSLSLMVRPRIDSIPEYSSRIQEETSEVLKGEPISPDEAISRTLRAKMGQERNKFFLYLDPEKLLRRDPDMDADWRRKNETQRTLLIKNFCDRLWNSTTDFRTPNDFTIISTTYTGATSTAPALGQVLVEMKYDEGAFFQKKQYTFTLLKDNGIWKIQDYKVLNLERQVKVKTGF